MSSERTQSQPPRKVSSHGWKPWTLFFNEFRAATWRPSDLAVPRAAAKWLPRKNAMQTARARFLGSHGRGYHLVDGDWKGGLPCCRSLPCLISCMPCRPLLVATKLQTKEWTNNIKLHRTSLKPPVELCLFLSPVPHLSIYKSYPARNLADSSSILTLWSHKISICGFQRSSDTVPFLSSSFSLKTHLLGFENTVGSQQSLLFHWVSFRSLLWFNIILGLWCGLVG